MNAKEDVSCPMALIARVSVVESIYVYFPAKIQLG